MRLSSLIDGIKPVNVAGPTDIDITSVSYHSSDTGPGHLFVAIRGIEADGHDYISQAISRGARAVVLEDDQRIVDLDCTWITVRNSRIALATVAQNLYSDSGSRIILIGITGTNGKTTTSFLIESIFKEAGFNPGVIGTIQIKYADQEFASAITTPESLDLYEILHEMVEGGTTHGIIEVSSHGLDLHRIWGLQFETVVFTNLSRDHLDYHETMEKYLECKKQFFTDEATGKTPSCAVINVDDPASETLMSAIEVPMIGYGINSNAHVWGEILRSTTEGISARIHTPRGTFQIHSSLLGETNLYNILAAVAVGLSRKIDLAVIRRGIEALKGVPGRLEKVPNKRGIMVIVDYAHTNDALERLLKTARELKPKRVITLFGCGGDRDRGKRLLMGAAGAQYSDLLILTSDNPRTEPPLQIIAEIEKGVATRPIQRLQVSKFIKRLNGAAYTVVENRREAIHLAIRAARPGDCVIIAGKGHEDYQIVGKRKTPFSDTEEAKKALDSLSA